MNEFKDHIIFKPVKNGVIAVISGALISSFRISLPKMPAGKLLKIIPNIMSDTLSTKENECHFALLDSYDNGEYLVALCDRDLMQNVKDLARAQDLTLKGIWPDYMMMPVPVSGTNIMRENNVITGRNSDGTGFSISADLFPALNLCQCHDIEGHERIDPPGSGLATGAYNPRLPVMNYIKYLKTASLLALSVFALWFITISLDTHKNEQQRRTYQDAQLALFKEKYPEVRRIVDVEAQLKARAGNHQTLSGQSALTLIDKVFGIIFQTKGINLETFRYDVQNNRKSLFLTVASTDFASAEQLKANFQQAGITVLDKGGRQDGTIVYNDFDLSVMQ